MKFAVSFTVALATCVAGDWLGKPGESGCISYRLTCHLSSGWAYVLHTTDNA